MLKNKESILRSIPDFYDEEEALRWIIKGKQLIQELDPSSIADDSISYLEWNGTNQKQDVLWGLYSSVKWRKIVLATFLADLVSYSEPADQVNFDRLLYVMHQFPTGFRTWCVRLSDQSWWPVGYTGWYPMLETTFEQFENNSSTLKNRMVVPELSSKYLYLFNFSVAPQFKKSVISSMLLKQYIQDICAQKAQGLACITVSNDGVRVAKSLEMEYSGDISVEGHSESVFTKRGL